MKSCFTLCYVMLCYVMSCCVMLCYDMLCYVMLCYTLSIISRYYILHILYITISTPRTHKHNLESVPHAGSAVRILANHDLTHSAIITLFLFSVLLQYLIAGMQFHLLLQRQKGRERR